MAHYFVDADHYGDTHLWRADDADDSRPVVVLSQRGLDPEVWRAACTYLGAPDVRPT